MEFVLLNVSGFKEKQNHTHLKPTYLLFLWVCHKKIRLEPIL